MKRATITAVSFDVQCPTCGECQPSPETGSHVWTVEDVRAACGSSRTCVSCRAPFQIGRMPARVPTL